MEDEERPRTLKERMDNIERAITGNEISKKKKKFKFKIPFKAKLSKSNVKKNYATIQIINDNGHIDFIKKQIDKGTIEVDGINRIATADYVTLYKNKPFIILPAWSIKPFSPVENYEETVKEKMTIAGRRLIAEKMKLDAIKPKRGGFGIIGWIVLGIAVIGVGYFLIKGGKIF